MLISLTGTSSLARQLAAHTLPSRPHHVRLAGGEPHFAHQYPVERDRLAGRIVHLQDTLGGRRFQRIKLDPPLAVFVGHRRFILVGEFDGDHAGGSVESPHEHIGLPLQNQVVRKRGGQLQLQRRVGGECDGAHEHEHRERDQVLDHCSGASVIDGGSGHW